MAAVPLLVVSLPPGLAGPQLYLQAVLAHPHFRATFDARCWWTEDVYRGLVGKWRLWRDARRWLREVRPRAVYVVADLSLAFWLGLALRLAGAPALVFHSHNNRYDSPRGLWQQRLFRQALRHWTRARLAVGPEAAQAMYDTVAGMVHVPGLIDFRALREPASMPVPRANAAQRIGCIGRLSTQKHQSLLIEALAMLGSAGQGIELWLIGEGGDRDALVSKVAASGLAGRVRFVGETPDIAGFYAELDALAVPSLWEGQCRVAAEAQSLGLPVLVSPAVPDFALLPNPPARRIGSWAVADWAEALADLLAERPPRRPPDAAEVDASVVALESGVRRLCEALQRAAA